MSELLLEAPVAAPPDDQVTAALWADVDGMSAAAALDHAVEITRLQARLEARRLAAIARFVAQRSDDEWAPDLLAAEASISLSRANRDMNLAEVLRDRLPRTRDALRRGLLDRVKLDQIDYATSVLDDEHARRVDELLYPKALGLNPRQLADFVRRTVVRVDPVGAARRAEARRAERRVAVESADDGMAWLNVFLGAEDALACKDRVDRIAGEIPVCDPRSMEQRRADVVRDLILGRCRSNVMAHVYVTVDAATLLNLNDLPGTLRGYGPLDAEHIRELAYRLRAEWSGVLVDGDGCAAGLAEKKYRFRGRLAEFIRLRDQTCDFPACNRAAQYCDIDHTVPYQRGGPTSPDNGRCRCRRHHRAKQSPLWSVMQDGATSTWTSDLRNTYVSSTQPIN